MFVEGSSKHFIKIICGIAAVALTLGISEEPSYAVDKGEKIPEIVLASKSGGQVPFSLEQFKGKVILLDIWASWCTPCRYSMPWLSDLQERYGEDNFQVVTINVDSDKEDAAEIISTISEKIVVKFDPEGKIPEALNVQGMPTSFLIDTSGNVISVMSGFRDSQKKKIEEQIKTLLKSKTAA